jgi:hypothetical protein
MTFSRVLFRAGRGRYWTGLGLSGFLFVADAVAANPETPAIVPSSRIALFDGRDLSQFYTWLRNLKYEDPDRVFTVVQAIDGAPAIRASGQHYGGIVTRERYANYRLTLEFRWGLITWDPRRDKARDAGILLHCQGPDGNAQEDFNSPWMRSVEYQIIEGGTGDMLLVGGYERPGSERILTRMTVPIRQVTAPGSSSPVNYWDPNGVITPVAGRRTNWFGRDPKWDGRLGFRGPRDVEKPVGAWNQVEIICDGSAVAYFLNGVQVNGGTDGSLSGGRILFQSEGAEIFYRKIELHPLVPRATK